MKKIIALVSAILAVMLFSVLGLGFWLNQPGLALAQKAKVFFVRKGDSASLVAYRLEKEELVRSALLLRAYYQLFSGGRDFRVGAFQLPAAANSYQVLKVLLEGQEQLFSITIPEGASLKKVSARLKEHQIIDSEKEFLELCRSQEILEKYDIPGPSLEGFLFPDTYKLPYKTGAENYIDIAVKQFFKKLKTILPDYEKKDADYLYKRIVLASIIERESRLAEESPLMASVFLNRLKIGMPLQSCATVEYVITEIQDKPHPSRLYFNDLKIMSEYNTYQNPGLPPGPICSPGLVALKAAFFPKETDYLYFARMNTQSGKHYFSKSLDEHNRAYNKYIR